MLNEEQLPGKENRDPLKNEGHDLFSLSTEAENRIKEIVKKTKAIGYVFIHPFFDLDHVANYNTGERISIIDIWQMCLGNKDLTAPQKKLLAEVMLRRHIPDGKIQKLRYEEGVGLTPLFNKYAKKFTETINSSLQFLLLGEVEENLPETTQTIRGLGYKGEIVWYKTNYSLSSPSADTGKNYSDVADKLSTLGVQKLVVGGQDNIFEEPSRFDDDYYKSQKINTYTIKSGDRNSFKLPRPTRCVGEFVTRIAETGKFEAIAISKAVFPFSTPGQQELFNKNIPPLLPIG